MAHLSSRLGPPTSKRTIIAVAVLLAISLATAIFAWQYNHRELDITPYLRAIPNSDAIEKHGRSETEVHATDSGWTVEYRLHPGFSFPYSGMDLVLDSSIQKEHRDFSMYQSLRIQFRHRHAGSQLLRFYINSARVNKGKVLVVPNEAQFRPSPNWEDHDVRFDALQIPSWFIAQNDIELKDQRVRLEDVKSIRFETPDLYSETDSGAMEVRQVFLTGEILPPMRLLLSVQILWIAWGVAALWFSWLEWRNRAIEASGRADLAAEIVPRVKTEFLATMSHEIRTPLNGVIVPAQLLQDSSLSPEQRDQVQTILESGRLLSEILQDSLDYFKIEAGRMELDLNPFSPLRAVESVRRIFEPKAKEKGLTFRIEVDPSTPTTILGDSLRVRQILINLVSNALKFTPQGEVVLQVSRLPPKSDSDTSIHLRFAVKDTGIGISPDHSSKLFQKFTQLDSSTSRKFGGTGLGLSIAQGLVQMMGGRIEMESAPGKGAHFHFTIAFTDCGQLQPTESHDDWTLMPRTFRVLVVDDNRVNLRVATSALAKLGCETVAVGGANEALCELQKQRFDLVLMDCHMPEVDGFEASLMIRAWVDSPSELCRQAAALPIIALTADVLPDIRERCLAAKMDSVLPKPFNKEQLSAEIQRWAGTTHS